MGLTIWKARLSIVPNTSIMVPAEAEFLSAHTQYEEICVWFRCNPSNPLEPRNIAIVPTGGPCPETGKFLGTVLLHGGSLVFHVFSEK